MGQPEHRSASRVLDILEILASSEKGYTLTELSYLIGAPKSSIFPILHTLAHRHFISSDSATSKYHIGIKSFAVGSAYLENQTALSFVRGEMNSIVESCSETCQLGILDKADVLYIAKVDSPQPIRMISAVGKRLPAYATALGKALLCDLSAEQVKQLYPNELKKITPNTINRIEDLINQLNEVRETCFSKECEEATEHIQCIAVPLFSKGKIIAAMSVTIPVFRSTLQKQEEIKSLLKNAQLRIEKFFLETGISLETIQTI